jgi:two-component system response regulator AtoC
MKKILVAEDEQTLREGIVTAFRDRGWQVTEAADGAEAMERLENEVFDVLVTDYKMPHRTGLEVLKRSKMINEGTVAVVMTAYGTVESAIEVMKAGAYDYVLKPVVMAELHLLLERAVGAARMEQALQFHHQRQASGAGVKALIGESPAMQELKATIRQVLEAERRVAEGDLPAILIVGETGTGKELVARSLHFDGARAAGPFVEINCASIPSQLLESELFGHEKGAFTDAKERRTGLVEAADGGTLFLDEIGEIDLSLQAKLLKLLEEKTVRRIGAMKERKVNLRIISATNRDLAAMVKQGTFRGDLYFRLRIISLTVPSLRQRGEDILLLARHFLKQHARRYAKPGLRFSPEAEQTLLGYYWPGNVRELRNMLEQTVLLAEGNEIHPAQLAMCPGLAPDGQFERAFAGVRQPCMSLPKNDAELAQVERSLVIRTLERTGWNVTRSAKLLGLSRDMMRYRIEKMGLQRPVDEPGSGFGTV